MLRLCFVYCLSLSLCHPLVIDKGGRIHFAMPQLYIKRDSILACRHSQVFQSQAQTSFLINNCGIRQRLSCLPPFVYCNHRSCDHHLAKVIQCVSVLKCFPLFCLWFVDGTYLWMPGCAASLLCWQPKFYLVWKWLWAMSKRKGGSGPTLAQLRPSKPWVPSTASRKSLYPSGRLIWPAECLMSKLCISLQSNDLLQILHCHCSVNFFSHGVVLFGHRCLHLSVYLFKHLNSVHCM